MDKPFNYVDPFSQEAVMNQAENYYDNPSDYVDMSIDEDLLNDNLTDDSFLFEDKFHGLPF